MEVHTGVKFYVNVQPKEMPYKCKDSKKAFTKAEVLDKHKLIHSLEKPYKCKQYDKSFSWKSNFNRHLTGHSGEKPFKCNLCEKTFAINFQLV